MTLTDKMIWHMETRLDAALDLAELADLCAVSRYHMVRSFRQATGLSPISYLRARRLSRAARQLATGDRTILSVALDAQYASHEAFTRAFANAFGILPQQVRQRGSVADLSLMEPMKMDKEMIVHVDAPKMQSRPGFRVVGLGVQCSFAENSAIPLLWQAFNARAGEIHDATVDCAYGLCCDIAEDGQFRYVAGFAKAAAAAVPEGMEAVNIPTADYAVFTHKGHIVDLPKTVYTIWNKALPDAGLMPQQTPDFEVYDKRFDPATGRGAVEIWIPVHSDNGKG